MKSIIVPTDFSNTAKNAYQYALDLAANQGSQLKVVNVCHPGASGADGAIIPDFETLIDIQKRKLAKFIESEQEDGSKVVSTMIEQEVMTGFAHDELIKLSQEADTEVILMGTTGSSNLLSKWFGSVSSSVAQDADCPVWLVPPNATFKGIKKILYAGNYESADQEMMERIIHFAAQFNADIQLLHVEEGKGQDQDMEDVFLENLFKKIAPSLDYVLHSAKHGSIENTLYQFADDLDADLIVLVNKRRNFWQSLFHKSTTKSMVLNAKKPLLVLHD